jgi:hypothetical protein
MTDVYGPSSALAASLQLDRDHANATLGRDLAKACLKRAAKIGDQAARAAAAIARNPEKSAREIARELGIGNSTVSRAVRAARVQREALAAGRLCAEITRFELFELGDDWMAVVDIEPPEDQPPIVTAGPDPAVLLPELHGLIEQIQQWYSKETIDGLREILAAAEARLTAA